MVMYKWQLPVNYWLRVVHCIQYKCRILLAAISAKIRRFGRTWTVYITRDMIKTFRAATSEYFDIAFTFCLLNYPFTLNILELNNPNITLSMSDWLPDRNVPTYNQSNVQWGQTGKNISSEYVYFIISAFYSYSAPIQKYESTNTTPCI